MWPSFLDKEIAPAPLLHSSVFIYATTIPYHAAVKWWRTEKDGTIQTDEIVPRVSPIR